MVTGLNSRAMGQSTFPTYFSFWPSDIDKYFWPWSLWLTKSETSQIWVLPNGDAKHNDLLSNGHLCKISVSKNTHASGEFKQGPSEKRGRRLLNIRFLFFFRSSPVVYINTDAIARIHQTHTGPPQKSQLALGFVFRLIGNSCLHQWARSSQDINYRTGLVCILGRLPSISANTNAVSCLPCVCVSV